MSPGDRRRVLITATACVFANFLALLGLTPLYPNVAHDLGLGVDGLGLYFGLSSAVGAVLQVPIGVLADRVGRRPILTAGLFFMALAQLLRWQASSPFIFALAQFAIGCCSPFVVAPSYAIVADAFSRAGRAQALGVLQAGINLGQVAGFLAAGFVGPALGWRGFSLLIAFLPALLLPLTIAVPEPPRPPATAALGSSVAAAFRFLARPTAAALAATGSISLGSGFAANYLLPFLARAHGLPESTTSFLLVPYIVGSVVGAPIAGGWADRAGFRTPVVTAIAVAGAAMVGFALAGFSYPAIVICYVLVGGGVSSAISLVTAVVAEIATAEGTGTGAALGGLRLGQQFGPALGPAAVGVIYVRGGAGAAFLALAAALAVAAVAGAVATGRARRASAPAPT